MFNDLKMKNMRLIKVSTLYIFYLINKLFVNKNKLHLINKNQYKVKQIINKTILQ